MATTISAPKGPRPIVFFDISIGDNPVGRMKMEFIRVSCYALSLGRKELKRAETYSDIVPE